MTNEKPLEPLDCTGIVLHPGDPVRVVGLPDLSGLPDPDELGTQQVFQHILGTYKRIEDFDEFGHAHLSFRILSGPIQGWHSVWIEPYLLRLRRRRNRTGGGDGV